MLHIAQELQHQNSDSAGSGTDVQLNLDSEVKIAFIIAQKEIM